MRNIEDKAQMFDLDALIKPEEFIAAAETEDELGCVLRMHLCLERYLDEFAEKNTPEEDKKFHLKRQTFAGKLSLAVAYGLSKPIAECIYLINRIRNDFAHKGGISLKNDDIAKLADLVDEISVPLVPKEPSVKHSWIELCAARPGEQLGYGKCGARIDFVLVCAALLKKSSGWLVMDYLKRNPHIIK